MPASETHGLMESGWTARREALDAPEDQRARLLARARAELGRAVGLARGAGATTDLAQALHLLANVELDAGRDEPARAHWVEAVRLLRETGDDLQLAHKLRHLGDLDRRGGRIAEAEAAFDEVMRIYRSHPETGPLDLANAVRRVALLAEQKGDRGSARGHWTEARQLYRSLGIEAGVDEAEEHLHGLQP